MLRDRNSIFFTGFVLGAIFSYSGMMGFLGGCVTGAIIIKNFGKNFELNKQNPEWIEVENIENGENKKIVDEDNKKEKDIKKNFVNNFLEYFGNKNIKI